jgi:FAD/FMN-containing dehydrogenase
VLKKEGRVTYFVGPDNFFSHAETDVAGSRFALATLIANRHVRAIEVEGSDLGIAHRTLMHWTRQLEEKGPGSFYAPRAGRGGVVLTPEKLAECGRGLDAVWNPARLTNRARLVVTPRAIGSQAMAKPWQAQRRLRKGRRLTSLPHAACHWP